MKDAINSTVDSDYVKGLRQYLGILQDVESDKTRILMAFEALEDQCGDLDAAWGMNAVVYLWKTCKQIYFYRRFCPYRRPRNIRSIASES